MGLDEIKKAGLVASQRKYKTKPEAKAIARATRLAWAARNKQNNSVSMPVGEKKCSRCREIKSLECFHVYLSAQDGRQGRCKDCTAVISALRKQEANRISAEWYSRNREARSIERKLNPEPFRVNGRRRRAAVRNAEGSHTASEIKMLLFKQKWLCANCSTNIKRNYHADHIEPLSKGGSDYISNIQMLCPPCNMRKHNKDPIIWARENGRLF